VPVSGLEQTLLNLPRIGKLVKDRGYRQIWRFEHEGRAYFLKFYPRGGGRDRFRRATRGSPAVNEFGKLQKLQSAKIPAPRAVAVLVGFVIEGRAGDALILDAIEPSVQLDQYCNDFERRGEPIPDRLELARQIRDIVRQLAQTGLGHEDLHPGNFLLHAGKLYLLDGYAVKTGGLKMRHLLHLGHSVGRWATRADLQRGWNELGPGGRMPMRNAVTIRLAREFIHRRFARDNRYFGRIEVGEWSGTFFKHDKYPRRWSAASRLEVTHEDWHRELPRLMDAMDADQLQVLKRSKSGDVLAGQVQLGGNALDIIIKRPRRRYWYRYLNEIGRGTRARRAWVKSWKMILRNLPCAWPLIYLEHRRLGYVTDGLIIFERVPGAHLARADLDVMAPIERDMLFRRAGRILREIERHGFSHFDAKASNFIVHPDDKLGPGPVLIDIDGIRQRRWIGLGMRRLLKSMHDNKQYSVGDSLALCQGYAPRAKLFQESPDGQTVTPASSPVKVA